MTPSEIKEAMRFGSTSDYAQNDLGKFGLGLKTSSLSQCDLLTVSSRKSAQKGRIYSYSWDVPYICEVDEWEILLSIRMISSSMFYCISNQLQEQ
jgi:hypothetical protein